MTDTYEQRVTAAVEAEARGVDVLVNELALPGALVDETVSHHVARWEARRDGSAAYVAGCAACAFLSRFVERDHCAKTLDQTSAVEPASVYWWAAFWFALAFGLVAGVAWLLVWRLV